MKKLTISEIKNQVLDNLTQDLIRKKTSKVIKYSLISFIILLFFTLLIYFIQKTDSDLFLFIIVLDGLYLLSLYLVIPFFDSNIYKTKVRKDVQKSIEPKELKNGILKLIQKNLVLSVKEKIEMGELEKYYTKIEEDLKSTSEINIKNL